jgi:hypothetical protein
MRFIIITLLYFACCAPGHAADPPDGRWAGSIRIPGNELEVFIDLKRDASGAWTGSVIIPGMNIKGAALTDIAIDAGQAKFAIASALGTAQNGQGTFTAHIDSADSMSGEFLQAGNTAAVILKRVGPPLVEMTPKSTPVSKQLEGRWVGDYDGIGGYPRHVTITLSNHAKVGATAEFVVVGKQTTNLPVDMVVLDGSLLRLESNQTGINFEGRIEKQGADIEGVFEQGPFEFPLTLRRAR